MSRPVSNALLSLSLAATASLVLAAPALALPGLDLNADLYGGLKVSGPSSLPAGNMDLDLYAGTPILKASVHALAIGQQSGVAEGVLRWELPVPFIAIRPGIGYQASTLFSGLASSSLHAGAIDSAPYGNLWVAINPPLLPVTLDGAAGISYPLGLGKPVVDYLADVNVFPLPLIPVGVSARYRGYSVATGGSAAVSTVELGLRVNL